MRDFLMGWLEAFTRNAAIGLMLAYPALDAATGPSPIVLSPI